MASLTVRISAKSHEILRELAAKHGETMQTILDKALETYRRDNFMDEFNAAYAALRADPTAWKEIQDQRALWDKTLLDGLDANEEWREDGTVVRRQAKRKKRRA